ncbi:MAG: hypothetical protein ACR2GS_00125 [Thermomicrobiales bacterium]
MVKRVLFVVMSLMLMGSQVANAQDETPEPGPGAASQLPAATVLGEGWTRYDVVSPDVLARYSFEMTPDVFSEGAAGLYAGPNGARVVLVNLVVTDSRVAIRASWEDATELLDSMTRSSDYDFRRAEDLETMGPPPSCVEAKRFEGVENTYLAPVGATMCAFDPDQIWIVYVSGTVGGNQGVGASDALVETILGG